MPCKRERRQRIVRLKHLILSAFLVSAASVSHAGEALTGEAVTRFASQWPGIADALAKADAEFDPALDVAVESQLQDMAASDSNDSGLDRVATAHGYRDFEGFVVEAVRILIAAKWAKDPPDEADLKAALAAVEGQTGMDAESKGALMASLEKAYDEALAAKPSDADIETVRPHLAALDEALAAGR